MNEAFGAFERAVNRAHKPIWKDIVGLVVTLSALVCVYGWCA